ncbi:MAG: hypothetical protein SGCHY_001462, partial [Lobulomycetales sp.]
MGPGKLGWKAVGRTTPFHIPKVVHPEPTHGILCADLRLSGFMPDHLDTLAYFARHSASVMRIPSSPVIHMPTDVKKWWLVKSPFVHAKSKEIFEKRTFTRTIQLYDAHPTSVRELVEYVKDRMPAGVDVAVDMYEYVDPDTPSTEIRLEPWEKDKDVGV